MAISVSDIGQNNDMINRIGSLRKQLFEAQRQIATGKKSDKFSGIGTQSQQLQTLRASASQLDRFTIGIDTVEVRANLMDNSLDTLTTLAEQMLDAIRLEVKEGDIDIDTIKNIARENLNVFQDLLNTEHNGRFLFSGTDISNAPYADPLTLTNNIQGELSDWLDGTQTLNQFNTDLQNMNDTALGYSGNLAGAGDVYARINQKLEVNYTVKADNQGIQDILKSFAVLENIQVPGGGDVANESEFFQIVNTVQGLLENGINDIQGERAKLSNVVAVMQDQRARHERDEIVLRGFADDIENIDIAEAVTRLRQLETSLQASFESTSLVSRLTLINFI